jgi:high-affinity nickel-transport protein
VFATRFSLDSGFWGWLNALDFEQLGYVIVGLFVFMWVCSFAVWKGRRIEERWGGFVETG